MECARAIRDALEKAGIPGEVIELKGARGGNIWSNSFNGGKGGNISENGRHVGVKVGDRVYDNHNPTGVPLSDWLGDLHTPGGFLPPTVTPF